MTAQIITLPPLRTKMLYRRDRPALPFTVIYGRSPERTGVRWEDFDDYNPALEFALRLNPGFDGHYYVGEAEQVVGLGFGPPAPFAW